MVKSCEEILRLGKVSTMEIENGLNKKLFVLRTQKYGMYHTIYFGLCIIYFGTSDGYWKKWVLTPKL
jgi:hypothetical protein